SMLPILICLLVHANAYTMTFVQKCPTIIPVMRLADGDSERHAELLKDLPQNQSFTISEDVDDLAYFSGKHRRLRVGFIFLEGEDREFDEVEYGIAIMKDSSMETVPIEISPNDADLPAIACDSEICFGEGVEGEHEIADWDDEFTMTFCP
ncbi:hypothetical protein PMAYCL1PPCAC_08890, partial [Pristionchus mayeri]